MLCGVLAYGERSHTLNCNTYSDNDWFESPGRNSRTIHIDNTLTLKKHMWEEVTPGVGTFWSLVLSLRHCIWMRIYPSGQCRRVISRVLSIASSKKLSVNNLTDYWVGSSWTNDNFLTGPSLDWIFHVIITFFRAVFRNSEVRRHDEIKEGRLQLVASVNYEFQLSLFWGI